MNKKKEVTLEFFDGETIENNYFLLGNSQSNIIDMNGNSLRKCLDFLFETSKKYNYFFVMDYDINMMFSHETNEKKILGVFNSEPTNFYDYEITYFRHKILFLKKGKKTVKFYDLSNFFKTSFLKTLKILDIKTSELENDTLEIWKLKRNKFTAEQKKEIIAYNKIECELGIKIAKRIHELLPSNLKTWGLYGASGLSQKFLTQLEIDKVNPYGIGTNNIFESAYFGGRMETFKIGTFGKSVKYDINSAYPNFIKELREVKTVSEILIYNNEKIKDTDIYSIELEIHDLDLIGLLPYRLKSGYLVFPKKVSGWYYGFELREVLGYAKKYLIDVKILNYIHIDLGIKIFNDNEIEYLYYERQKLKKQGKTEQYIFKILLNAIYGKFCQRIGTPKFQNFYYAGLITSNCRARLLNAVIDNPYDIVFFATDGILSLTEIKKLKIDTKLGNWDKVKMKRCISIQAGVYECTSESNKKQTYEGQRGFRIDFNVLYSQIKTKTYAIIKTNQFIGNTYFFKNRKAFAGFRCKFKSVKKRIEPTHQIKRVFLGLDKFKIEKKYESKLITVELLKVLDTIEKVDFSEPFIYQ